MTRARSRLAWALATWFGCGRVPIAPGTMGTLGAIPLYLLAVAGGRIGVFAAAAVVTAAGVWAASHVARDLGTEDPQIVVIDEVAGFLVTMIPVAHVSFRAVALGFVLFRGLDAMKPWPIRLFERLPGGVGIVFDDLAAGALGAAVMTTFLVHRLLP